MAGKVVVPVHLDFFRNEKHSIVAAHSSDLGLTGYGSTEEEAREAFKRVFSAFIQVARTEGFLESMLNRIGVSWHWADEYNQDYEDVSERCGSDRSEFVPIATDDDDEIKMAA